MTVGGQGWPKLPAVHTTTVACLSAHATLHKPGLACTGGARLLQLENCFSVHAVSHPLGRTVGHSALHAVREFTPARSSASSGCKPTHAGQACAAESAYMQHQSLS